MAPIKTNQPKMRPRLQVPITYVDDTVLLTDKECWTWSSLPDFSTGLPTPSDIQSYVLGNSGGLAKLVAGREDVRGHLRIFHIPTTPDDWAADVVRRAEYGYPALRTLMDHQVDNTRRMGHVDRKVMLGIHTGGRHKETLLTTGPFKWLRKGMGALESATGTEGEIVSVDDLRKRYVRANSVRATLRTSMGASPATADEVLAMILNSTNPGMRTPKIHLPAQRFGPGLQEILFNDPVRIHNRMISYLDIDGEPIMHAAYVPIARTEPEYHLDEIEPWLYSISQVGFPVDWSIRFRLRPPHAVAADLRSKTAHARDMYDHMREAGKTPPIDLEQTVSLLEQFEQETKAGRTPGLYAQYVARVCDPDKERLAAKVQALKENAHDASMEMQWSTGDQLAYALSEIPGGPDNHRPYEQHTNLSFLFGGGPTWSNHVGDRVDPRRAQGHIGPAIAQTLTGIPYLVPLDPFNALERNQAPGFMLTGGAGSGKSYAFQLIALQLALRGVTLTFIDPKPDVVDVEGRRFRLPDLIEVLTGRRPNVIDVKNSPDGILEPFRLGKDAAEGIQLAMYVLEWLLGGHSGSHETEAALSRAVNGEADAVDPTLSGVMRRLGEAAEKGSSAADAIYQRLLVFKRMDYARLLFGEPGQEPMQIGRTGEVTFIVTRGLELPSDATKSGDMDLVQRMSAVILSLLTRRATAALMGTDPDYPKALMVDEAHSIVPTEAGRSMINTCIKMLRAMNGVVGLASQELRDMVVGDQDSRVINNTSTLMSFRSRSADEAGRILSVLNEQLDPKDSELRRMIGALQTGECWMKDVDGRVEQIAIDYYIQTLKYAFETNAEARRAITVEQVNTALMNDFGVTWTPLADRKKPETADDDAEAGE